MQIPKSLLIICMAAFGVSSIHAQRPDSDLQTKAREQLRQKMAELQSQQPESSNAAPVSPKPPRKAEAPVAPPVAAAPAKPSVNERSKAAPAAASVPEKAPMVYNRLDSSVEAKAREALRQKIAESSAEEKATVPVEKQPAKTEVAAQPAKVEKPNQVDEAKAKADEAQLRAEARARHEKDLAEAKAEAQARAEAAKQQKIEAANEAKLLKAEAKAVAKAEKDKPQQVVFSPVAEPKEKVTVPGNTVTVATPAPSSKEARLADLFQQYKTDKISPITYHAERAKILAEP
jgi:colicin import membrane protein